MHAHQMHHARLLDCWTAAMLQDRTPEYWFDCYKKKQIAL